MKYRFTMDHFQSGSVLREDILSMPIISVRDAVTLANALLEQWEKESESVYGHYIQGKPTYRWYKKMWHGSKSPHGKPTHTAILWNPRKISEKGEGE